MEQTGAYAIYASLPDGEQVLANLDKFFEFLRNEESKPGSSLAKVAHALEERVQASNRDSQANPSNHGIDAVQIMTIHASKGLQFPLVVVANMQKMIKPRAFLQVMRVRLGLKSGIH
jgi:ATP-dependent helicase/nuclease subunit A